MLTSVSEGLIYTRYCIQQFNDNIHILINIFSGSVKKV